MIVLTRDEYAILEQAADWMLDEKSNGTGDFALDYADNSVLLFDPQAVCFCAHGKIMKTAAYYYDYLGKAESVYAGCVEVDRDEVEAVAFDLANDFSGVLTRKLGTYISTKLPVENTGTIIDSDPIVAANDYYEAMAVGQVIKEAMESGEIITLEAAA